MGVLLKVDRHGRLASRLGMVWSGDETKGIRLGREGFIDNQRTHLHESNLTGNLKRAMSQTGLRAKGRPESCLVGRSLYHLGGKSWKQKGGHGIMDAGRIEALTGRENRQGSEEQGRPKVRMMHSATQQRSFDVGT